MLGGVALAALLAVSSGKPARGESVDPELSALYDGEAFAFMYLPLALTVGLHFWVEPPTTPRLFDPAEGGQSFDGNTVPEAWVMGYVGASALTIALVPEEGRWLHLKGFAEAQLTTLALTEVAKNTFGRHRPHYGGNTVVDERRSFFSGHASMTFVTSTYLGAYLHGHVFSRWRDVDQSFAWWELAPLGALAAGSVAVAYSRIIDHRHHPSDVVTGAAVGTGLAAVFYLWQESRVSRHSETTLTVVPTADGVTVGLVGRL